MRFQLIDQIVIERYTQWVNFAGTVREDTSPGNGETVGFQAQFREQFDVFFVVMIVITGYFEISGTWYYRRHINH